MFVSIRPHDLKTVNIKLAMNNPCVVVYLTWIFITCNLEWSGRRAEPFGEKWWIPGVIPFTVGED